MRKIKIITLFLILFIAVGCTKKKPNLPKNQRIRFVTANDPESLLPQVGIDQTSRVIVAPLFEGLTRFSPNQHYDLGLAKSVSLSSDKRIYTFTLRDAKWSDGTQLTAYDFERSWRRAVAPASLFPRAELFYVVKNGRSIKLGERPLEDFGVKALDKETLVVELEHPSPYFLNLIATTFFAPFKESKEGDQLVSNGPFRLKLWDRGKRVVLEKNPLYWDAEVVQIDELEAFFIDDATTGYMLFEKGKVDWVGSPFRHLPLDAISHLRESNTLQTQPVSVVYWISLNTEDPSLSHVCLRRALGLAIDRNALTKHVLYGQIPSFSVVPESLRLCSERELLGDEEPEILFERALEELGKTREDLSPLVLHHSNVPGQKKLSEAIQQCWENAFGIEVELRGSDWNTFFAHLQRGEFQVGGCLWRCVFDDPICTLEFFKEGDSPYNPSGWENKAFQELLIKADEETDLEKRIEYLKQAEVLLISEMPAIPLYSELFKFVKRDCVKGVYITNGGDVDFKWAHIEQR